MQTVNELTVYHGTCREKWRQVTNHQTHLYLTDERSIADTYANEWTSEGMTPLVVTFKLSDLVKAKLELQPNWETVSQSEDGCWRDVLFATWKDTLKANATFCVHGDIENIKRLGNEIILA